MKSPKILFVPTNCGGVVFWRMYQFFRKMKEKGIDAFIYRYQKSANTVGDWEHLLAYDDSIRAELYGILKYCDIGVVQYLHIPLTLALTKMFQEEFGKTLYAEIDDEIISTPEYNPAFSGGMTPGNIYEKVTIEHLRQSDGVITSTDYLKECYKRFNPDITTIPNCIDFDKWNIKKKEFKRIRIGWIGGGNHNEDLRILVDVIPKITEKYKDVEFMFVHGVPEYLKEISRNNSRVRYSTAWSEIDKYPQFSASYGFDIGLAPLIVNRFNMAKSNLRWLEYSALSIPTVATKIEPYSKSIEHGKTGYLCETEQDWIDNISLLIENEKLRKEVGTNARQDIFENYNLDKVTDKYIRTLRKAL